MELNLHLNRSEDISDIRYTAPWGDRFAFCRKNDILVLVNVHKIRLGFFLARRVARESYRCHYFISPSVRKYSFHIFNRVVPFMRRYHSLDCKWYATAERRQRQIRFFIRSVKFELHSILNDGRRLYVAPFRRLLG